MGCNSSKDVQVDDTKKAPLPKEDTNRNTKVETNKQNGKSVKIAPRKGQLLLVMLVNAEIGSVFWNI